MAVEAGFEPAKIVASKTTALNRLATRQYQLLVCPSCQASDRFVSVYVFSPRSHRSFPRRQKGNHHENPYDNREHHQPDTI